MLFLNYYDGRKGRTFHKKYVFIEGNLKNRYLRKGFLEKKHCKTRNYYKYFQLKFFSRKYLFFT